MRTSGTIKSVPIVANSWYNQPWYQSLRTVDPPQFGTNRCEVLLRTVGPPKFGTNRCEFLLQTNVAPIVVTSCCNEYLQRFVPNLVATRIRNDWYRSWVCPQFATIGTEFCYTRSSQAPNAGLDMRSLQLLFKMQPAPVTPPPLPPRPPPPTPPKGTECVGSSGPPFPLPRIQPDLWRRMVYCTRILAITRNLFWLSRWSRPPRRVANRANQERLEAMLLPRVQDVAPSLPEAETPHGEETSAQPGAAARIGGSAPPMKAGVPLPLSSSGSFSSCPRLAGGLITWTCMFPKELPPDRPFTAHHAPQPPPTPG